MLPVIALVGRPNVGKSTLFNRLTRSRDALVADFPGLTRDRQYGEGRVGPRPYIVVDTGGFEPVKSEGIVRAMASQAELAIEEADVVILVDVEKGTFDAQNVLLYYVGTSRARIRLEIMATLSDDDCREVLSESLHYSGKIRRAKKDLASALNAIGSINS